MPFPISLLLLPNHPLLSCLPSSRTALCAVYYNWPKISEIYSIHSKFNLDSNPNESFRIVNHGIKKWEIKIENLRIWADRNLEHKYSEGFSDPFSDTLGCLLPDLFGTWLGLTEIRAQYYTFGGPDSTYDKWLKQFPLMTHLFEAKGNFC